MLATLTSCVAFGPSKPVYPELPSGTRTCFEQIVPRPAQGPMTRAQVKSLIAKLKRSESAKVECGKRIIAFYDTLAENMK